VTKLHLTQKKITLLLHFYCDELTTDSMPDRGFLLRHCTNSTIRGDQCLLTYLDVVPPVPCETLVDDMSPVSTIAGSSLVDHVYAHHLQILFQRVLPDQKTARGPEFRRAWIKVTSRQRLLLVLSISRRVSTLIN